MEYLPGQKTRGTTERVRKGTIDSFPRMISCTEDTLVVQGPREKDLTGSTTPRKEFSDKWRKDLDIPQAFSYFSSSRYSFLQLVSQEVVRTSGRLPKDHGYINQVLVGI